MQPEPSKPEVQGWYFQSYLGEQHGIEYWSCHDAVHARHSQAKVLISQAAEDQQRFERETYLSSTLPVSHVIPSIYWDLDAAHPIMIQPIVQAEKLDDWFLSQSMPPSTAVLVWMARQMLEAVHALHRLGFAHDRLRPDCLLVDADNGLRLNRIANCLPIGDEFDSASMISTYAPPEWQKGRLEVSSSADIFALGMIFCELVGETFQRSPLARQMLDPNADCRPTSGELLPLFLDLERQLFRQQIAA